MICVCKEMFPTPFGSLLPQGLLHTAGHWALSVALSDKLSQTVPRWSA